MMGSEFKSSEIEKGTGIIYKRRKKMDRIEKKEYTIEEELHWEAQIKNRSGNVNELAEKMAREFIMEQEFELEIYPELCCDECMKIIHNHISCPICLNTYAGSSIYGQIEDEEKIISCEECDSEFERIGVTWNTFATTKVRLIKNGRVATQ